MTFNDIVIPKHGFLRGPFGGDLKKEIFVPNTETTYKVYEQGVVLQQNNDIGRYYITSDYYDKKMNRFSVQEGDFLVSCSGVNMGAIFQIHTPFERGIINQALLRIRLNPEIIDDDFFYYYFILVLKKQILKDSGNSTIPNFPPLEFIKNLLINIPEKKKQKAIASILSNIDRKIALNNAINAELEKTAKLLYDYWFVQFDFPNAKGKPYRTSGGKMVYNEHLKREIPEGWEVKKIDELGEFKNGANYEKANTIGEIVKIVNVRDISASSIFIDVENLDEIILSTIEIEKYLLDENDIIFARSGIPGATRLIEQTKEKIIFCGFAIRFRLNDKILKNYLFFPLKRNEEVAKNKSIGSIMPNISQDNLKDIFVQIPSVEVLNSFNKTVSPIFEQMIKKRQESAELTALRDFLLPLLMNGQVKVG
jgi:type I restriction enzyme S subunit